MTQLVRSQVFGSDSAPTVYYVVGFRMRIARFAIPIKILALFGFRIVAFDVDPRVLLDGDPELLGKALDEFMEIVKQDSQGRKVAGAYGISLGSFFAMNTLTLPKINKVFMNTGGGSIVQAVWEMDVLSSVKESFENKGNTREITASHWDPIDISQNLGKIAGKKILANASYADEYLPIKDVLRHAQEWPRQGINFRIILSKHLKHRGLIIKTLMRFYLTSKFFRSPDN